ncbi:MAG: diaminopimelate epimerase [Betaproteobacteria bacterium SG8_40]|nr:MAG: diaminopimelate epimerase [Betaproteobacteria bacterium SG8_40]
MEGAGNDFVVVDATRQAFGLDAREIRQIADRHTGIGFDQLLVIEPPRTDGTDFYYRIFNADGNEVSQCGNGARCFVRYVHDKTLSEKSTIRVETASGVIEPRLETDGNVTVDMGAPRFEPADIPMRALRRERTYTIVVEDRQVEYGAVSMGNPHAVQLVPDIDRAPVREQGPLIERNPVFPQGANAGYMQVVDRKNVRLRVWERGAGETLACGTGACAAVVMGIQWELLDPVVCVHTRGGKLRVAWQGKDQSVFMTGPARTVFEGEIEIQGEK